MSDVIRCAYCDTEKHEDEFPLDKSKTNGRGSYCRPCRSIYRKEYYQKNKERLKHESREYHRKHNQTEEHRAKIREYHKSRPRDLVARRKRHKERYRSDPCYALNHKARSMLKRCFALTGANKEHPTFEAIGYTAEMLKQRIEMQFHGGMSWDNQGDWEIDHRIPLARFISRGEMRPHVLNALSNLQPLWKFDNRSKGARYVG